MRRKTLVLGAILAVMALPATQGWAITIDHFDQTTGNVNIELNTSGPTGSYTTPASSSETGLSMVIGGNRDMLLEWVAGDSGGRNHLFLDPTTSLLKLSNDDSMTCKLTLTYNFSASESFSAYSAIVLNYFSNDLGGSDTTCTLYTDATDWSYLSIMQPSGASTANYLFSSLIVGGGTGVDLSNVNKLVFMLDTTNVPSADVSIHSIDVGQPVPEPVTIAGILLGIGGLVRYTRKRAA
jgi:hypothetical protein